MNRALLQQALDALLYSQPHNITKLGWDKHHAAIEALRTALASPEQPDADYYCQDCGDKTDGVNHFCEQPASEDSSLRSSFQDKPVAQLTDDEVILEWLEFDTMNENIIPFARALLAAQQEKNNE